MKLFGKKKSGAVAALEGEIDALTKRRDALQARFDAANNALSLAYIDRRNHLISAADDDTATAARIDQAILAGERDVAALRDALDEIDSRLTDAQHRLELEREGDERERRALALEKAAAEIESAAKPLEAAADALAIALHDFIERIPADLQINKIGHGGHPIPATPAEIASAIVAQGLAMSSGLVFEPRKPSDGVLRPLGTERALVVRIVDAHGRLVSFLPGANGADAEILPTSLAAEQILVTPLREQAARLRLSADMREAAE